MSGTFYEQLGGVAGVFDQWGACERTVVACALARKVPWPGLKLLQRAVDAALRQHVDDERLERDANDEVLLASLLTARSEDDDDEGGDRLRQLLAMLPLLRTDNSRAKDVYMTAAPALVQRYVDAPRRTSAGPDLCRQLLTYLLVHPALTHHDQRTLTQWLRYLESHISGSTITDMIWQKRIDPCLLPNTNIWGTGNDTFRRTIGKNVEFRGIDTLEPNSYTKDFLQESFSKNGRDVDISIEGEKVNFDVTISQPKSQRSNSLTPPSTNFVQMSSSAENLSDEQFVQKPRSFSLSSEHSLSQMRPIGIMYGTTGSETRLDDLRSTTFVEYPGMSMVAQWLKSLRLHKYVWLFTNISYEQMMAMDEEYLEKLGVTKGARHKLLVSIKKLNTLQVSLDSMEADLMAGPSPAATMRILERLRAILISPLAPHSRMPHSIVRVLEMVSKNILPGKCTLPRVPLFNSTLQEESETEMPAIDPMSLHCWLVEKALHHESFSAPELTEALKRMRHRLPPRQFFHHVSDLPLNRRCIKQRSVWRTNPTASFVAKQAKRPWVPQSNAATGPAVPRGKSHSYPPYPPPQQPLIPLRPPPPPSNASCEDYSSLDALCLQMTEQAIN